MQSFYRDACRLNCAYVTCFLESSFLLLSQNCMGDDDKTANWLNKANNLKCAVRPCLRWEVLRVCHHLPAPMVSIQLALQDHLEMLNFAMT